MKKTAPTPKPSTPGIAKRLGEYNQEQLTFDFMFSGIDQRYSNTIELYDFTPKYHWGKVTREAGKYLDSLEREFECRNVRYKAQIFPAKIKGKDGIYRDYYPGKREELVEDALRKLATEGQGLLLDDYAAVTFTLYQLQQELKQNGHSYSYPELKDALYICSQTHLEVTSGDGSAVLKSNMFETLGLNSRDDWQDTGEKTRCYVRFNSLVTASIRQRRFRQLDYERVMSYTNIIARQLHKRLSHHYTQASIAETYVIKLSTIIRDFGLTLYESLSDNLRHVIKALEEMKEKDVVLKYKLEKTFSPNGRKKLLEAKVSITTTSRFNSEMAEANKRQKAAMTALESSVKTIP